jgi:hypothetical protein
LCEGRCLTLRGRSGGKEELSTAEWMTAFQRFVAAALTADFLLAT